MLIDVYNVNVNKAITSTRFGYNIFVSYYCTESKH